MFHSNIYSNCPLRHKMKQMYFFLYLTKGQFALIKKIKELLHAWSFLQICVLKIVMAKL